MIATVGSSTEHVPLGTAHDCSHIEVMHGVWNELHTEGLLGSSKQHIYDSIKDVFHCCCLLYSIIEIQQDSNLSTFNMVLGI
ncbi:hypothetical protein D3C71_2126080 [compost metagenome]